MTSQEEWRQIAYQRHLGETGSQTGNIHNAAGYETYVAKQKASHWNTGSAPVWPSSSGSFSRRAAAKGAAVFSPSGYAPDAKPMSPNGVFAVFAVFAGLVTALFSWQIIYGAGAGLAVFGAMKGLQLFARTRVAAVLGTGLSIAIHAGLLVGAIYLTWLIAGMQAALWFSGIAAALVALGLFLRRWRAYAVTPSGQIIARRLRRIVGIGGLAAIAGGIVWLWSQGYL